MAPKKNPRRHRAHVLAIIALSMAPSAHAFVLTVPLLSAFLPMLHQLVETTVHNALTLPTHVIDSVIQAPRVLPVTDHGADLFNDPSTQAMAAFEHVFARDAHPTQAQHIDTAKQQAMTLHQSTLIRVFQHLQQAQRWQTTFLNTLTKTSSLAHGVTGQLQALQANGDVNILQARLLQQLHGTLMAQTQAQITHAAFVVQQQAQQQQQLTLSLHVSTHHDHANTVLPIFMPRFTAHGVWP